jgi:methyl coenzyme M reductase subunit C
MFRHRVGAGVKLWGRDTGVVRGVSCCRAGVWVGAGDGIEQRGTMPRDLSAAEVTLANTVVEEFEYPTP